MKRKAVNVRGGSKDPTRGTWCTPAAVAIAVGPWHVDPFSNPRSHIEAADACMLENGGDGFGDGTPGSYRVGRGKLKRATSSTRFWGQPPYELVQRVFDHYAHTRWCFLLRFDPRTDWFKRIYRLSALVCVFYEIEFEPPPGVPRGGGNSFPHALYYRDARDVTAAVLRMTVAWRTNNGT
jgi:hypothetical protein